VDFITILTVAGRPVEAKRLLADWQVWRREYGDAYDAGERVPGPPHAAFSTVSPARRPDQPGPDDPKKG
jgi:hypothetical protein